MPSQNFTVNDVKQCVGKCLETLDCFHGIIFTNCVIFLVVVAKLLIYDVLAILRQCFKINNDVINKC